MAHQGVEAKTVGDGPLVSLIMCVWRPRPDWLMQAVASALGQRGCHLELILVDDGSPEPVADILASVKDDRLRIIRIEHGGVSRARNAGIAASRGSRLRFIDGDDVLDLDSTARLLRLMGGDEDVIAYGATVDCDADLRPRSRRTCRITGSATIACLLGGFDVRIPALLFPRRIVEAAGDWNPALAACEDWDFTLRALEHGRVRGEDEVELYYRRHPGGASSNMNAVWDGTQHVARGYLDRHPEARGSRLETRIDAMLNVLMAGWLTGGRPWRSARFWEGVFTDPRAALPALKHVPAEMRRLRRYIARRMLPAPIYFWVKARVNGSVYCPPAGRVRFGSLRRLTPLSRAFGQDRGLPIDRYYIERFMAGCQADVRGRVLEIGANAYTRKFGGSRVVKSDVLDIRPDHPEATIVADLTGANHLPSEVYDCIILTQTLQFIYDVRAALKTLHRMLKPGGVLLGTFGGISQVSRWDADRWGHYWNFTTWSARRLLEEVFPPTSIQVDSFGNVLAAAAFLYGLASNELHDWELNHHDPDYEVLITIRAVKPPRQDRETLTYAAR